MKAFHIKAREETIRKPRIVKIAALQNSIQASTSASIIEQRNALWHKIQLMIKGAAMANVNIICMQEAWSN